MRAIFSLIPTGCECAGGIYRLVFFVLLVLRFLKRDAVLCPFFSLTGYSAAEAAGPPRGGACAGRPWRHVPLPEEGNAPSFLGGGSNWAFFFFSHSFPI